MQQGLSKIRNPMALTLGGKDADFSYLIPHLGAEVKGCPLQGFGRGYSGILLFLPLRNRGPEWSQTSKATGRNWLFKHPCGCGRVRCSAPGLVLLTLCTSHLPFSSLGLPLIATSSCGPEMSFPLHPAGLKLFRGSSGSTPSPEILGAGGS